MNISPIDNRYSKITEPLNVYVSDFGMNKLRCNIEIEYFIFLLNKLFNINDSSNNSIGNNSSKYNFESLRNIYRNFSLKDLENIREKEKITNHDIKALEYFIIEKLQNNANLKTFNKYNTFVHFALTSQDINSVTNTLTLKYSITDILIPELNKILEKLKILGTSWYNNYMISKTHGQSASTTSMGKELFVYHERLENQLKKLINISYSSKFGGAVGNLNAHVFCYPEYDWNNLLNDFLKDTFSLKRNKYTTQIDHYDNLSEIFDILRRINTIFLDLNQDIWLYISYNYFKLKVNVNETGSSTMPHKVNPINFENSEGNIHMANSILTMFSNKLPVSRLQRDLTDSTITRNIGVALSYILIAYNSLLKGLNKLQLNNEKINEDLQNNWCILMEPLQYIMKTENIQNSYEIIKKLSRNHIITKEKYLEIVNNLNISDKNKNKLLNLTPKNYNGILSIQ